MNLPDVLPNGSASVGIRRLELPDAGVYRALRLRGLREHPDAFTSSFEEEERRPLADTEKRLSSPTEDVWGAFTSGQLAGMAGLSRETRDKNRHKATLVGMYVVPEAKGFGLGRALVDTVIRKARADGVQHLVLTVTDGNAPAIALYKQSGFAMFGIEPDAIRIGTTSYAKQHMTLEIAPP